MFCCAFSLNCSFWNCALWENAFANGSGSAESNYAGISANGGIPWRLCAVTQGSDPNENDGHFICCRYRFVFAPNSAILLSELLAGRALTRQKFFASRSKSVRKMLRSTPTSSPMRALASTSDLSKQW